MRGISVDERIIWFASRWEATGDHNVTEEEWSDQIRRDARELLIDIGLTIVVSTDMKDLRLQLLLEEPALLIAVLKDAVKWAGWEEINGARENGKMLPVFVISEGGGPTAAVAVFEAGGNEYMDKPFHFEEFRCRVRNLLSLTGRKRLGNVVLRIDGLLLEPTRRHVSRDGEVMKLTPKEFDLLYYLASNAGEVCPREEILSQVWDYQFHAETNVVDVYIRHLRKKVDKGYRNKLIHTIRGTGYVLKAP